MTPPSKQMNGEGHDEQEMRDRMTRLESHVAENIALRLKNIEDRGERMEASMAEIKELVARGKGAFWASGIFGAAAGAVVTWGYKALGLGQLPPPH